MILFNDRITAFHKEKVTNTDGSTTERKATAPFIQALPCQVSYGSDDKGSPKGRDRLPQSRDVKIFVWFQGIPKGQMFKRGDYIIFERLDEDGNTATHHEGVIGEPKVYPRGIAHVELSLEAEQ